MHMFVQALLYVLQYCYVQQLLFKTLVECKYFAFKYIACSDLNPKLYYYFYFCVLKYSCMHVLQMLANLINDERHHYLNRKL